MTDIQKCKGAAEFLSIAYENHFRSVCLGKRDYEEKRDCFKDLHLMFSTLAETYANNINMKAEQFNKCFAKPVNKILEDTAGLYEDYLELVDKENRIPYTEEEIRQQVEADEELDRILEDWPPDHDFDFGYNDEDDYEARREEDEDDYVAQREYEESHSLHLLRAKELKARRDELVRFGKQYGFDDKMREEIEWIDDWFEDNL